jgi:hypothetical protein
MPKGLRLIETLCPQVSRYAMATKPRASRVNESLVTTLASLADQQLFWFHTDGIKELRRIGGYQEEFVNLKKLDLVKEWRKLYRGI